MGYKIYFLLRDMKPVYIGHTKRHVTRVMDHRKKDHNCVRIMSCKNKQMALYYEKRWIARFQPEYNKNSTRLKAIRERKARTSGEPRFEYKSKSIQVHFSVSKEEYDKIVLFAEEQDRTVGNYISYAIVRALRHDSFFVDKPLENTKLRIA